MVVVDDAALKSARRVAPVFSGVRLKALRELHGQSQSSVAADADITASALSQAERGETTLSAPNIAKIAAYFGVSPAAFAELREPMVQMQPQFRHLRRTPVREQRRAAQFIRATSRVARCLRDETEFPEPFSFTYPVDPEEPIQQCAGDIELAASLTRLELGLPKQKPIGHKLIDSFEANGIAVVRDPDTDHNIDAYSAVVGQMPVIVLDGGGGSVWDRDNFNLAHELGHIVMHRGIGHKPGTRTVEAQAHRFASAFLGPAKSMRNVLPQDLEWGRYLSLKRGWGMSMAALVRRAKDLGVIDDAMYTRAMKQQSAYGWRQVEPGSTDRSLPTPRLLSRKMTQAGISPNLLAERTHLPEQVVLRIVGGKVPSSTI